MKRLSHWSAGLACALVIGGLLLASSRPDRLGVNTAFGWQFDVGGGELLEQAPAAAPDENDVPAQPMDPHRPRIDEAERQLLSDLKKEVSGNYFEAPLSKVLDDLARQAGVQIWLDEAALLDDGIGTDEPITRSFKDLPLELALNRTLQPHQLAWFVSGEVLHVTTELIAEQDDEVHTYRLHSLEPLLAAGSQTDAVLTILHQTTTGPWLEEDGLGGHLRAVESLLLVRQSRPVHREVQWLLESLTAAVQGDQRHALLRFEHERDRAVREALLQTISVNYSGRPLKDVAADLAGRLKIEIELDERTLLDEGIGIDEPITIELNDVSARTALERLLALHKLATVVHDARLLITTELAAEDENKMQMAVFIIRDLAKLGFTGIALDRVFYATRGPWLDADGVGGTFHELLPGIVAVRQSQRRVDELASLFDQARQAGERLKPLPAGEVERRRKQSQIAPGLDTRYYASSTVPQNELIAAVTTLVDPGSWQAAGGPGVIHTVGNVLVIQQTPEVHARIDRLMYELNRAQITAARQPHRTANASSRAEVLPVGSGFFQPSPSLQNDKP